MNWTEFKAAILPTMEELLLNTNFGWRQQVAYGQSKYDPDDYFLVWDRKSPNPFINIIQELIPQFSPELQAEILKCDRFDKYQDLDHTEQMQKILLDITAAMINDFSDVATTDHMKKSAQWDLNYLENAPKASDYADDEKYNEALEKWEADFDYLKNKLNNASENFEDTYEKFKEQWDQLTINQFYNSRYDINENKMKRSL